jgi:predicted AlkP superfamily pyrophosphatase or phosphodiesterase
MIRDAAISDARAALAMRARRVVLSAMIARPLKNAVLGSALATAVACGGGDVSEESSGGVNAPSHRDAPDVVLVSFDGFGAELLGRHPAPAFERVATEGVRAERMIPVYPTKTFPTHYSIATGMYTEHHGLVGNRFWAPDLEAAYSMSNRSAVEDAAFYRGEPIWVTAERQGMVAASYFFVGSEAPVGGVQPTYWYRFDADTPNDSRVDQVLDWLAMPPETRPHMITLYFEDVDVAWHNTGPDSRTTAAAVAEVDRSLGRLLDGIERLPEGRLVFVVLVSDHGLMSAPAASIDELDMTLFPGVQLAETGPYASLFIEQGGPLRAPALRDSLAALFTQSDVWLRPDVPERFHYSADPRIGDIVIAAAPGHRIETAGRTLPDTHTHGWDNLLPEMGAIFLAMGPGIAPGQVIPPFEAVHVYPFIAELLGLVPNPDADGRLEVLRPILER